MKSKNKKKVIYASLALFLVIAFFVTISLTQNPIEKSTVVTEEGVITFTSQELRPIDRFLSMFSLNKQAVFSQDNAYVGESVTISDYIPYKYNNKYQVDRVIFSIYKGTNRIGTYETSFNKNKTDYQRITASYIPDMPGIITARTELITCDEFGMNCQQYVRYLGGYGENNLTVTARPSDLVCSRTSYWGAWEKTKDVTNGYIQEREYKSVNTNCIYETTNVERMLLCENNYSVRSTNNSMAIYTGSENCVPNSVNVVIGKECEIDLTQNCSSKEIIVKTCENGFLKDTNNKCEVIKESTFFDKYRNPIIIASAVLGLLLVILIIRNMTKKP